MPNDYYQRQQAFPPRTKAKSEQIRSELDAVASGFEKLPKPTAEADGFTVPVKVGTATDPDHAATLAQLTGAEAEIQQNREAAQASASQAAQSQQAALGSEQAADSSRQQAEQHKNDAAQSALEAQQAAAGDLIDDAGVSSLKAWSSEKLQQELQVQTNEVEQQVQVITGRSLLATSLIYGS